MRGREAWKKNLLIEQPLKQLQKQQVFRIRPVSRALNDSSLVKPQTKLKIKRIG
jgi:hypothetical protein